MNELEAIQQMIDSGIIRQDRADELIRSVMHRARTPSRTYAHQVKPLAARVQGAIDKVCGQLPIRLCSRISSIRFGPDGVIDPTFEVEYMGGKVIQFENVDEFPTQADIARIALECP